VREDTSLDVRRLFFAKKESYRVTLRNKVVEGLRKKDQSQYDAVRLRLNIELTPESEMQKRERRVRVLENERHDSYTRTTQSAKHIHDDRGNGLTACDG